MLGKCDRHTTCQTVYEYNVAFISFQLDELYLRLFPTGNLLHPEYDSIQRCDAAFVDQNVFTSFYFK